MKLSWLFKGISVASTITGTLPQILQDGKITVNECVALVVEILEIFDVPVSVDIPAEIMDTDIGMSVR